MLFSHKITLIADLDYAERKSMIIKMLSHFIEVTRCFHVKTPCNLRQLTL